MFTVGGGMVVVAVVRVRQEGVTKIKKKIIKIVNVDLNFRLCQHTMGVNRKQWTRGHIGKEYPFMIFAIRSLFWRALIKQTAYWIFHLCQHTAVEQTPRVIHDKYDCTVRIFFKFFFFYRRTLVIGKSTLFRNRYRFSIMEMYSFWRVVRVSRALFSFTAINGPASFTRSRAKFLLSRKVDFFLNTSVATTILYNVTNDVSIGKRAKLFGRMRVSFWKKKP